LGYHAAPQWERPERWGLPADRKQVWLPAGITFPWYVGPELWRVTIRQVGEAVQAEQRYITITGSGNTLYGIDQVRPHTPAMLVEGVLDAFRVIQEADDLLDIVPGGTTGGRRERWIGRLPLASVVLVSLDADEAGETASA
jgi:hypothetical protein